MKIKTTIFLFLSVCFSFSLWSQTDKELTEMSFDMDKIKGDIYFLASDVLKGRNAPSPELKIAAEYLKTRFQSFGIKKAPGMDTYYQKVPFDLIQPATSGTVNISNDRQLSYPDDFIFFNGNNTNFKNETIFVNYGSPSDFEAVDVKDKIAIAFCGDGKDENVMNWLNQSKEKLKIAEEKGAKGLIEIYGSSRTPYSMLKRFFGPKEKLVLSTGTEEETIPQIWINASDSTIVDKLTKEAIEIEILIEGIESKKVSSQNVVGYVEGSDPVLKDEIVVYSAHYDHVGVGRANAEGDSIYNGARDNAVGTATVLSIAENIGKYPTRRSALFVLFTGEEKGLLGSKWFVDHAPVGLEKIIYCFNSDNGGYNDIKRASIIGLTRTSAEESIQQACESFGLLAMEDSAKEQGLFDRSDNVNFARKGIPAPTFSLGFERFDAEIFKYYHQPSDHADNLDYEYLEKFFKAYVLSSRLIANADQAPFWNEGDKYYEAGIKLYNK